MGCFLHNPRGLGKTVVHGKILEAVYVMGGGQTVYIFYCFLNFLPGGVIKIGNILVGISVKGDFCGLPKLRVAGYYLLSFIIINTPKLYPEVSERRFRYQLFEPINFIKFNTKTN